MLTEEKVFVRSTAKFLKELAFMMNAIRGKLLRDTHQDIDMSLPCPISALRGSTFDSIRSRTNHGRDMSFSTVVKFCTPNLSTFYILDLIPILLDFLRSRLEVENKVSN